MRRAASFSGGALRDFHDHAVDPAVAASLGVTERGGKLVLPCVDGEGQPTQRFRSLDGRGPKVKGEAGRSLGVTRWWPPKVPQGAEMMLVTEGEIDALAAVSAVTAGGDGGGAADFLQRNLAAIVSVPGTGFPLGRLVAAARNEGARLVLLAFDGDDAGRAAAQRAAQALLGADVPEVRLLRLPDGADLSDLLARPDSADRAETLANAIGQAATADGAASIVPAPWFQSARELREVTPAHVPWVLDGLIARGAITLLAGKPKVGKSTLTAAVIEAVASCSDSYLGRSVNGGPVIYASEEGAATLRPKLPDLDDLRVMSRDAALPRPSWPDVIAGCVAEAERVAAVLLVIDTFAYWAALAAEREKDAGAVQEATDALVEATSSGLAVLLLHHQRKARGEGGDAVRGSGALVASVDIVLQLEQPPGCGPANRRQLSGLGRFAQTPPLLLLDRDQSTGEWIAAERGAPERATTRAQLAEQALELLADADGPMSQAGIAQALGRDGKDGTVRRALKDLTERGEVVKDEAGIRLAGGGANRSVAPPGTPWHGEGANGSPRRGAGGSPGTETGDTDGTRSGGGS